MKKHSKYYKHIISGIMAISLLLSVSPGIVSAAEIDRTEVSRPTIPIAAQNVPAPKYVSYKGGIDLDHYKGKIQGEWNNSNSYNVQDGSEGNIGYVAWNKQDWGNAKWQLYFRQAGTYDVALRMKVDSPKKFSNFKFGIYKSGDPNPDMVIPNVDQATNRDAKTGYADFVIKNVNVEKAGNWNIKIMDSSKEVVARLDYMQFKLEKAVGPKDNGVTGNPKDETVIKSNGEVIEPKAVKAWMTSTEMSQDMSWYQHPYKMTNQLTQKPALDLTKPSNQQMTTIHVNPNKTYQTFLGMGTSLEGSTIWNLNQLDKKTREKFIDDLVNPEKGGMTLFRLTIGTPDFTSDPFYTYYDIDHIDQLPSNFKPNWYPKKGETGFSIQKDKDNGTIDTIHMVQAAAKKYGVQNQVRFFASSWTAPGWMKNNDAKYTTRMPGEGERLRGGTLSDKHINDLAMYYVRYLEEYAKEGIPLYAITLQNEPGGEFDYPSMKVTGAQEGKLAIEMKKLLRKSSILNKHGMANVKLWAYDHNPSDAENYIKDLSTVPGAIDAIDGVAFHDYSGPMSIMQDVYNKYLNKGTNKHQTVNLTERSVWGTKGANSIITYLRNDAISYDSWVTMLDSKLHNYQWPGTPDPTLFAREHASSNDYWAMPEFYITGQFARFIRPGYVRVDSDEGSTDTVRDVVFRNPKNNEYVAVVVNATDEKQNFKFILDNTQFIGAVPGENVATYVWKVPAKGTEPTEPTNPVITINPSTTTSEVDKTALEKLYSEGQNEKVSNYTTGSWAEFKAALNKAKQVLEDKNATQKEVNDALAALTQSKGNLKSVVKTGTVVIHKQHVGKYFIIGNLKYKVTRDSKKGREASVIGMRRKASSIMIPSFVRNKKWHELFKVTSIRNKAFEKKNLKGVVIGSNIQVIGYKAFYNNKKLVSIVIRSKNLKKVGKDAFRKISSKAVIRMAKESKKSYIQKVKKTTDKRTIIK